MENKEKLDYFINKLKVGAVSTSIYDYLQDTCGLTSPDPRSSDPATEIFFRINSLCKQTNPAPGIYFLILDEMKQLFIDTMLLKSNQKPKESENFINRLMDYCRNESSQYVHESLSKIDSW
jgi:hypothetical protein